MMAEGESLLLRSVEGEDAPSEVMCELEASISGVMQEVAVTIHDIIRYKMFLPWVFSGCQDLRTRLFM